jgi:hypothetical protein
VKILYGKVGKIDLSIPYKNILLGLNANCVIKLENIIIHTSKKKYKKIIIFSNQIKK